ncbi:MAG: Uma2 family endonuclease [Chloroflexi bacterium]|nr:Uma2 family endonuclease [Chloroflexota bacterium]
MVAPVIPRQTTIEYPESDGKPMAESELHMLQLLALVFVLRTYFEHAQDVYVGGNMMMYYVEGDPTEVVAPDVFVVKGVPKHVRRIYRIWEEGKGPDAVIELSSRSTRRQDLGDKRVLYEELGVQEFYIFDPLGEYLTPPLRAHRLVNGVYEVTNGTKLYSEVLGLELRVEGNTLRLFDPKRGEYLLTPPELSERVEELDERVEELDEQVEKLDEQVEKLDQQLAQEMRARHAAEEESARLRAELERLRGREETK